MARRFHFLFQNTRNGRPVASRKNKSEFRCPENGFSAQLAGTSRYESRSKNLLRNAKPCALMARQLLPARQIQGIPTQGTHPRGKRRPMQHCTPACLAAANMRAPVIHAPTARAARQGRTNRRAWPQNLFATCTWVQKARRRAPVGLAKPRQATRPVCGLRLAVHPDTRAFAPHGQVMNRRSAPRHLLRVQNLLCPPSRAGFARSAPDCRASHFRLPHFHTP